MAKNTKVNWAIQEIKVCNEIFKCRICKKLIFHGERYHDGGYWRKAHVVCVERTRVK